MDHVIPYPVGPSDRWNARSACKRDHDLKTRGDVHVTANSDNGSTTWRTRHGQHGVTPPRPYLNPPEPAPEPEEPEIFPF